MLKAKRALEKVWDSGHAIIELPLVENHDVLARELDVAGLEVVYRGAADAELKDSFADRVKAVRKRLGKSQEEFARDFGLEVKTLRGWEVGKIPDRGNRTLFRMIEDEPDTVMRILSK